MQPIARTPLPLYVVDDDDGVRDSLALLFVARRYRVQTFDSGESFLAQADTAHAGCVVLDVRMGGISGLQVFDEMQRLNSPLVVVFLSGHIDIPIAISYTKKGAFDCLEKPFDESLLLEKVAQAMRHAEGIASSLVLKREVLARWETLTPRETDVARLVRQGWANKRIADALQIGVRAVETYRAKVYDKLWVSNPTELDRLMRDNGIA
jgi:two-component system, LuxR family, response regulator TtrR